MQSKCRKEVLTTVRDLRPTPEAPAVLERADDLTWAWLASRCASCGACPDMLLSFGVTPRGRAAHYGLGGRQDAA